MKYLRLFESFLIDNRPSEKIEKKHNLPKGLLSADWKFPSGFSEAEVWHLCDSVLSNPENNNQSNYDKLEIIAKDLDYNFFPYKGVEDLPINVKFDILSGMSSGYNFDDIVWFSIDRKTFSHPESKEVRDCFKDEFGIDVGISFDEIKPGIKKMIPAIGWVPSLNTLNKLREMKSKL
jgi:hypothetical protein